MKSSISHAVRLTLAAVLSVFSACQRQEPQPAGTLGDPQAHHSHSTSASPARPTATMVAERDPDRAWCGAHGCYEDICFICNRALREKGRLWCTEHGRYEDRCWLCHPDEEDKDRAYCARHFLYEDECILCRPERKPGKALGKPGAIVPSAKPSTLYCQEHALEEVECGICHPALVTELSPGQGIKVRLPSRESAELAGVRTALPEVGASSQGIECYAEIGFNQNRFAQIAAPVSGVIQAVEADLGDQVKENQVVARIWSASIAEAAAKAVLARQTLERERKLRAQRVTSEKDLQEAEAVFRAAWQQLHTLGFTEGQIAALGVNSQEPVLLEVRAPFAGEMVERTAVRGALIEAGKPLFTLADRSSMWASLAMPESMLNRVQVGQQVELSVEALPDHAFSGTLTWIAAEVDERTRLARARAEMANPDGLLRSRMFARARILTRTTAEAVLVPLSAIQHVEGIPVVFVPVAADLFEARAVRLGTAFQGRREVLEGLGLHEAIVVNHSYALKSQLLISRLGAGCVD